MHGTRLHRINSQTGELVVDYQASVIGASDPPTVSDADLLVYMRPSRYSESDSLAATAGAEFLGIAGAQQLLALGLLLGRHAPGLCVGVVASRPTARCARSSTGRASAATTHT